VTRARALAGRVTADAPPAFYLLIVLVVGLALFAPGFATGDNLSNVGRTAAVLALAACGQAVVIITRGLDLSAASTVALMSVVVVLEVDHGVGVAFALGVLAVLAVGALNGLLVARFDIPPFLVTLGTLTLLHGLAALLVSGIPVEAPPGGAFSWPSNGRIGPFSVPLVLAIVGFVVLGVLLRRTTLGRVWFLIGSNPDAARSAGLRVRRATFLAYVVGAAFVAVAGLILTSRVHSGQPDLYPTLAFEAIAACAIGGLSLSGGTGRVSGVLIGVLVVTVSANGLVLLNVSSDVQRIVVGVLTVASVLGTGARDGGFLRSLRRTPAATMTPPYAAGERLP
jgi:ribose/xylose/arabinose/galactoside ABC-type transport system permease subunit